MNNVTRRSSSVVSAAPSLTESVADNRTPIIIAVVAVVVALGALAFVMFAGSDGRVGVVRTKDILEKYPGAHDARTTFTDKASALQGNLDTLRQELEHMLQDYEQRSASMPTAEREARQQSLRLKEAQVRDYAAAVEHKTVTEQQTLTASLINHVKAAAEEIARQRGIDVVLTIGDDGQVVYHDKAVDITDEVLTAMKQSYRGELKGSTP